MIGTRIGPYEILAKVGEGGMGEVYRARDTRLKREVAIKVLPDAVARDEERVARFQREAELLATLSHPHIASIYGLEVVGDDRALVMELVDGETLADCIARGPIPLDEALPIARQLVDALDYAHEHRVLHRDLKPANIKVTSDGQVKILDFGLARPSPTAHRPWPVSIGHRLKLPLDTGPSLGYLLPREEADCWRHGRAPGSAGRLAAVGAVAKARRLRRRRLLLPAW